MFCTIPKATVATRHLYVAVLDVEAFVTALNPPIFENAFLKSLPL
jgi:hypothetical protein